MADQEHSLESLLNRATNPAVKELDWDHVNAFCDHVNKELEGPHIAVRLLAHKIQSPQEREAEYALATLEACVKNCGQYFHQEIGKFRFLNEIIKVISPKYLGSRTSEKIKRKCIEILYSWKMGLPHEIKIAEAYSMLKAQGIVKEDPTYIDKSVTHIPPAKPKRADFEDEEKAKMLNRLLKSKNPEDLQAANRLIKNMVKDDMIRSEKISKRINELQTIGNNVQLLQEMIQNYNPQHSSSSDLEMMKELYESLEKLRPNLFRLASDTDEKDNDGINDILQANDNVMKVMSLYKTKIEGVKDERADVSSLLDLSNEHTKTTPIHNAQSTSSAALLEDDFEAFGISSGGNSQPTSQINSNSNSAALSELSDIFNMAAQQPAPSSTIPAATVPPMNTNQSLFNTNPTLAMGMFAPLNQPAMMNPQQQQQLQPRPVFNSVGSSGMQGLPPPLATTSTTATPPQQQKPAQQKSSMSDLDFLGQSLLQQNLGKTQSASQKASNSTLSLNQISNQAKTSSAQPSLLDLSPSLTPATSTMASLPVTGAGLGATATTNGVSTNSPSKTQEIQPLTDIFVPLETIKPGEHQPVVVLDKNDLKILIHVGKDHPRQDVSVMVVSTLSTSSSQITNYVFQAAVPKVMKVKLQPPSANTLPAYNPILPPTAITQVMLIANPRKEKVRLKYKITYATGDQNHTEMGEVDTLPI